METIDYEPVTAIKAARRAQRASQARALVASALLPLCIIAIAMIVRYRAWESLRWFAWEVLIMMAIGAAVRVWTIYRYCRPR